jgi:hypothetical protein
MMAFDDSNTDLTVLKSQSMNNWNDGYTKMEGRKQTRGRAANQVGREGNGRLDG